jgi:hypothetical protein
MEWIGEALALITSLAALYQRNKAKRAQAELARTKADLDAIRAEAGTLAPWEKRP